MSFKCLRFINELASQSGGNAIGRPELTLPASLHGGWLSPDGH